VLRPHDVIRPLRRREDVGLAKWEPARVGDIEHELDVVETRRWSAIPGNVRDRVRISDSRFDYGLALLKQVVDKRLELVVIVLGPRIETQPGRGADRAATHQGVPEMRLPLLEPDELIRRHRACSTAGVETHLLEEGQNRSRVIRTWETLARQPPRQNPDARSIAFGI
jgi:hypothetical protein